MYLCLLLSNPSGVRETFSIITTAANPMISIIHNSKMRMPLIIAEANQAEWLTTADEARIKELIIWMSRTLRSIKAVAD